MFDYVPPDENGFRYEERLQWTLSKDTEDVDGEKIPYWINTENERALCNFCQAVRSRRRSLKDHHRTLHRTRVLAPPTPMAPSGPGPGPRPRTRNATAKALHHPSNPSAPGTSSNDPLASQSHGESPMAPAVASDAHPPTDAIANEDQADWDVTVPAFLDHSGLAVIGRWKAILCVECKLCVPAENALGHLKDNHHFTALKKDDFSNFVQRHGLNGTPKDIVAEVKASRCFRACPWLDQLEGWWCEECGYATASEKRSADHGRLVGHFSYDEVFVSGERHQKRRRVVRGWVQTLFSANLSGRIPSIPSSGQAGPDPASKVFRQLLELKQDLFNPPILSLNDPRSLHPFITTSGFSRWIAIGKLNWDGVDVLKGRMKMSDETLGKRLLLHCRQMMETSFALCIPETYTARCIVNSPSTTVETTPFGELTSQGARDRYCSAWAGFIAYIINSRDVAEATRRFTLSSTQKEQLAYYLELLEDPNSELSTEDRNSSLMDAVEALTMLSGHLICHELESTSSISNHPLITYSILHSIKPGLVISNPVHISPFLASLEYFCRVTVMGMSYLATVGNPDVSFYKAVKTSWVWLKEGENTPFAWVRQMLHLTARFVYGSNQMPRFVWGLDDGKSYTFDGYRIQVSEYIAMLRSAVQAAIDAFFELWDSYGLPRDLLLTSFDDVDDDLAVRSVNYNFTRHPPNVKLQLHAEVCENAVYDSKKFCEMRGKTLVWFPNAIRRVFKKSEAFLRSLAAAIYLSSGQPPRGTELMSTLYRNINTRVRNVFVSNNAIVFSHFLNKTTFHLKSDKAIVREACPSISLVILNYLALVRSAESKMAPYIGTPVEEVASMQSRLFQIGSRHLTTDDLSSTLQSLWCKHVTRYGETFQGWGTAGTRQNAIYVGRRCVNLPDRNKHSEALYDLQAGHSTIISRSCYGVEGSIFGGDMTPKLMQDFCDMSRSHCSSYELDKIRFQSSRDRQHSPLQDDLEVLVSSSHDAIPTTFVHSAPLSSEQGPPIQPLARCHSASNATASLSQEGASSSVPPSQGTLVGSLPPPTVLPVALDERALVKEIAPLLADSVVKALGRMAFQGDSLPRPAKSLSPVTSPEVYLSMQKVLKQGDKGRFRSPEQAAATQTAWERSTHLLTVLPTGAGKTLVAEVTTRLERQGKMVTVILVPLKALAKDLRDRFEKGGVMAQLWEGKGTPFSQVLIAVFEQAGKDDFLSYLRTHVENKTLARIVVDECHYPVFSCHDGFRAGMKSLCTLATLRVPLVLLSATVPVSSTTELLDFYGVPQAKVIRASTNRPNIKYVVEEFPGEKLMDDNSRARYALQKIKRAIEEHKPDRKCKVIVYVHDKGLLDKIWALARSDLNSDTAQWKRYHASMTDGDKDSSLADWVGVILATSALGLGINRGDCGLVIHYEPPYSMLEYAQESGRAGRDGSPSCAVLLWNRKPRRDDRVLDSYLTTPLCRRRVMFGYMDGDAPDCLSLSQDNRLCDNCTRATTQASQAQRESLVQPNDIGPLVTRHQPGAQVNRVPAMASVVLDQVPWDTDEYEPPTDLQMVVKIAKVLHKYCSKCWLAGRELDAHDDGEFNCERGGVYAYCEEEFLQFIAWKVSWPRVKSGQFAGWTCSNCWLPGPGYHHNGTGKPEKGKLNCFYADGLPRLAWSVFRVKSILREYKAQHPSATTDNLKDWGAWLCKAGPQGTPQFRDLALWLEKKLASTHGRQSLWEYPM